MLNEQNDVYRPVQQEVEKLRGPIDLREEYTLARNSAKKLRALLGSMDYVHALGAVNGNQAMQMVKAGLPAIYLSGWQTASSNNSYLQMYPDQSLYPVDSVPKVAREINNTFKRASQIEWTECYNDETKWGKVAKWLCPIIADMEAGFGGVLNAFELVKAMIESGVAGVHLEDQLSSVKKCGHLSGKVLVPASEFIRKLKAVRLAAEVYGVDTVIIARTDANSARLLTTVIDKQDEEFVKNCYDEYGLHCSSDFANAPRTSEGFYHITGGVDMAISRGLQYAPYADLLWMETSTPSLEEARQFADAIHEKFPDKMLAYNCSPSFNWKKNLDPVVIGKFQKELGAMGYKFQFITLAGFHSLNYAMFDLARGYNLMDMTAYSYLQQKEFADESEGYTAHKHQKEVGTSYFDLVAQTIDKDSSTTALKGSTEEQQF